MTEKACSEPSLEALRSRIYHELRRELGSKPSKKDLKRFGKAIKRAIKQHW